MKPIILFFCIASLLIMATVHIGTNIRQTNDSNPMRMQITAVEIAFPPNEGYPFEEGSENTPQVSGTTIAPTDDTTSQMNEDYPDTASKLMYIPIIFMLFAILMGVIILIGIVVGVSAYKGKNTYFSQGDSSDCLGYIKFYINKHTIFRRFALMYSIIHYIILVLSLITTLITVYMVVETSNAKDIQIIFLLLSAIFSSLVITLRFDKVSRWMGK